MKQQYQCLENRKVLIIACEEVDLDQLATISIADYEKDALLLLLAVPLNYQGVLYHCAVAVTRHVGVHIKDLFTSEYLLCGVTWIPDHRFNADNPFDTSWWRGGGAVAITSLQLVQ